MTPRVISVASDVRMVQLLREQLPAEVVALTRDAPGSRSEDGSDAVREDANRRWIKTAVAEETVEVLRVFERERGQHDRAADGAAATCAALCEARVDVLLVHDDPRDERRAWFAAEEPTLVAVDARTIADMGVRAAAGPSGRCRRPRRARDVRGDPDRARGRTGHRRAVGDPEVVTAAPRLHDLR